MAYPRRTPSPKSTRYALFAVLGLVAAFIVAWIVDIAVRPVVNSEGLKGALNARSRSKVGMGYGMMMG